MASRFFNPGAAMSVTFAVGNVFDAEHGCQAVGVGINVAAQLGMSGLATTLLDRYPVFVSDYRRRGRAGALTPGDIWVWRDSDPWLVGLVVRETPQGATRLRYVEQAMLNLVKNWEREGLRSLALVQLTGHEDEWPAIREVISQYLAPIALPVVVYENAPAAGD